jgi:hypothetical protein
MFVTSKDNSFSIFNAFEIRLVGSQKAGHESPQIFQWKSLFREYTKNSSIKPEMFFHLL